MEYIGIIILVILFLWLLLHKNKYSKKENFYQESIGKTFTTLPKLTQHYFGID